MSAAAENKPGTSSGFRRRARSDQGFLSDGNFAGDKIRSEDQPSGDGTADTSPPRSKDSQYRRPPPRDPRNRRGRDEFRLCPASPSRISNAAEIRRLVPASSRYRLVRDGELPKSFCRRHRSRFSREAPQGYANAPLPETSYPSPVSALAACTPAKLRLLRSRLLSTEDDPKKPGAARNRKTQNISNRPTSARRKSSRHSAIVKARHTDNGASVNVMTLRVKSLVMARIP